MPTKKQVETLKPDSLWARYQQLSTSHKFLVTVFIIWLLQAIPKWGIAVTADGHLSAQIMKVFVTPRYESMSKVETVNESYTIDVSALIKSEAETVSF